MDFIEILRLSIPFAAPVVAGLGGVIIGQWLIGRNESAKRRLDFAEKQLRELYSPLLGIRSEIRALSELRVRVQDEAGVVWRELAGRQRALDREKEKKFLGIIEHHNEQRRSILIPHYRKMASALREGFFLAEASKREHLPALIEFVELWERFLDKTIPAEVIGRLDVTEENLKPLYENVENTFLELRQKLRARP